MAEMESCPTINALQAIESLESAIETLREKREGIKKEMDDQV